jgi:hypothetical protein
MHENPRPATLSDTRELGSRLMKLAAAALQPERPPRREFAPLDFQGGAGAQKGALLLAQR